MRKRGSRSSTSRGSTQKHKKIFCVFVILSRVPEDCEVVADRSRDDEEVPDEVVVPDAVRREEDETAGVSNSTGDYQ